MEILLNLLAGMSAGALIGCLIYFGYTKKSRSLKWIPLFAATTFIALFAQWMTSETKTYPALEAVLTGQEDLTNGIADYRVNSFSSAQRARVLLSSLHGNETAGCFSPLRATYDINLWVPVLFRVDAGDGLILAENLSKSGDNELRDKGLRLQAICKEMDTTTHAPIPKRVPPEG